MIRHHHHRMAATMPLGSVAYEREPDANGERWIWLEPQILAKLKALRGPGEFYSDVIVRLAKGEDTSPSPREARLTASPNPTAKAAARFRMVCASAFRSASR
jgi:hypothetical protein